MRRFGWRRPFSSSTRTLRATHARSARPDPGGHALVGPLGRLVLENRQELLEVFADFDLGRVWVTGAVARSEESWSSRLVFVVEGLSTRDWKQIMAMRGRLGLILGDVVPDDVLPLAEGSSDDVLLEAGS